MVWQGYPVLAVETTDLNKAFHPFRLAMCSNKKTSDFQFIFNSIQSGMRKIGNDLLKRVALVADVAGSIKNGFSKVFDYEYDQIMCWSHMKRKDDNRVSQLDNKAAAQEMENKKQTEKLIDNRFLDLF